MNMSLRCFLSLVFITIMLSSCKKEPVSSQIVESNNIADIFSFITPDEYNKETLVIFDLDNTLITAPTDLGSDQWVNTLIKQNIIELNDARKGVITALAPYWYLQQYIWPVPVTDNSLAVVNELQNKGVTVIALTARDHYIIYRTREQLERIGFDFTLNCPHKPFHSSAPRPALYDAGIIFLNGQDKGPVLEEWLHQMDYRPQKMIFIDDKLNNVQSIQHVAEKERIPFIGIRYGYLDERVQHLDMQKVAKEYEQFRANHPERKPLNPIFVGSTV